MFECGRYPYNNFLHHLVENIIMSCLESKNSSLLEHLLRDCDFVGKIIQAEKQFTLEADTNKVHDLPPSPKNCIAKSVLFCYLCFDSTI